MTCSKMQMAELRADIYFLFRKGKLSNATKRAAKVAIAYHLLSVTMDVIGKAIGVSRGRVRQLIKTGEAAIAMFLGVRSSTPRKQARPTLPDSCQRAYKCDYSMWSCCDRNPEDMYDMLMLGFSFEEIAITFGQSEENTVSTVFSFAIFFKRNPRFFDYSSNDEEQQEEQQ